jgi:hypothetical protein
MLPLPTQYWLTDSFSSGLVRLEQNVADILFGIAVIDEVCGISSLTGSCGASADGGRPQPRWWLPLFPASPVQPVACALYQ